MFSNILTEHVYMDQCLISRSNKTKKTPLGKQRGFVLLWTQHLKNHPQFFIHSYFCDCSSLHDFPWEKCSLFT